MGINTVWRYIPSLYLLFILIPLSQSAERPTEANVVPVSSRLLFLSAAGTENPESALRAAREVLNGFNIQFDELCFVNWTTKARFPNQTLLLTQLEDSHGRPRYYGLIMEGHRLEYQVTASPETYTSALTESELEMVWAWQLRHNIRSVIMDAYSSEYDYGTTVAQSGSSTPTHVHIAHDAPFLSGIEPTAVFPCANWHSPMSIVSTSKATPLAYFRDPPGSIAAAYVRVFPSNREEIHFYLAQTPSTVVSAVLGNMWVNFVTRGVYEGSRRIYLAVQMDDVFISTPGWDTVTHTPTGPEKLTSTDDFLWHANWHKEITAKMGVGSDIRIEMPLNGLGVHYRGYGDDELLQTARSVRNEYYWLTHTYSHMSLNILDQNPTACLGKVDQLGNVTLFEDVSCELTKNMNIVDLLFSANCGTGWSFLDTRSECKSWSPHSIVTPMITGLFNKHALQAFEANGVFFAVGDNSLSEYQPANWHHGIITTEEVHGHAGILIIPRMAVEVDFNCQTAKENTDIFNTKYASELGKNYTFEEIMEREITRFLPYLVAYRHDGYMFHQSNLMQFPYKGHNTSLLAIWTEAMLTGLRNVSTLPVISLRQDDLGTSYLRRRARDYCPHSVYFLRNAQGLDIGVNITVTDCNIDATIVGTIHHSHGGCGNVTRLDSIVIGVTGVRGLGADSDVFPWSVEEYGPDITTWVTAPVGQNIVVPLEVADGVVPVIASDIVIDSPPSMLYESQVTSTVKLKIRHPLGRGARHVTGLAGKFQALSCPSSNGSTGCTVLPVIESTNHEYAVAMAGTLSKRPHFYLRVKFDSVCVVGSNIKIDMASSPLYERVSRVLVLSATCSEALEPSLATVHTMLTAYSVKFDDVCFINATTRAPIGLQWPPVWEEGRIGVTAKSLYSAVVMTTPSLTYPALSGVTLSAISTSQLTVLTDYETKHGLRRVVMESVASAVTGVTAAAGVSGAQCQFGPAATGYTTGVIAGLALPVASGSPVTISSSECASFINVVSSPLSLSVVVGAHSGNFSRQELHFFLPQRGTDLYVYVTGTAWVHWVTRGLYGGFRRTLFWTQMDDVYKSAAIWEPSLQAMGTNEVRCNTTDLAWHVKWMADVNTWLGAGSTYRIGMPFNGKGVHDNGYLIDPLLVATIKYRNDFYWLTHTFSHMSLTAVDQDPTHCLGRVGAIGTPTTYADATCEIQKNWEAADLLFGAPCGSQWETMQGHSECATFSSRALVNPMISGLFNGQSIKGLMDSGIAYVVGDNSLAHFVPSNLYHALITETDVHGWPGLVIIPRFATEIYYNSDTIHSNLGQFNNRNQQWLGFNLTTMQQLLDRESERIMPYLLAYRWDGYMFHQTNLVVASEFNGRPMSLLAMWVEDMLQNYRKYYSLPVLTFKQEVIGKMYVDRMHRDACDYAASMAWNNEVLMGVNITSSDVCNITVPLTGVWGLPADGRVWIEQYGPDVTTWVSFIAPGQVFVPVNVPVSMIPIQHSDVFVTGVAWPMYATGQEATMLHVHIGHPMGPGTRHIAGYATRFSATVCGVPCVAGRVVDHGNGTYAVMYAASVAGDYTASVTFDGVAVIDTPVTKKVLPSTSMPTPFVLPYHWLTNPNPKFSHSSTFLLLSAYATNANEVGLDVIKDVLKTHCIPYEHVSFIDPSTRLRYANAKLPDLEGYDREPLYRAIIMMSDQLSYLKVVATDTYASAMTEVERHTLDTFANKYGIRQVSLSSYPIASYGATTTGGNSNTVSLAMTAAGSEIMSDLDLTTADVSLVSTSEWHTPATITDASVMQAIATFSAPADAVAVGLVTVKNHRTLHFFVSVSASSPHIAWAKLWIRWAAQGLYITEKSGNAQCCPIEAHFLHYQPTMAFVGVNVTNTKGSDGCEIGVAGLRAIDTDKVTIEDGVGAGGVTTWVKSTISESVLLGVFASTSAMPVHSSDIGVSFSPAQTGSLSINLRVNHPFGDVIRPITGLSFTMTCRCIETDQVVSVVPNQVDDGHGMYQLSAPSLPAGNYTVSVYMGSSLVGSGRVMIIVPDISTTPNPTPPTPTTPVSMCLVGLIIGLCVLATLSFTVPIIAARHRSDEPVRIFIPVIIETLAVVSLVVLAPLLGGKSDMYSCASTFHMSLWIVGSIIALIISTIPYIVPSSVTHYQWFGAVLSFGHAGLALLVFLSVDWTMALVVFVFSVMASFATQKVTSKGDKQEQKKPSNIEQPSVLEPEIEPDDVEERLNHIITRVQEPPRRKSMVVDQEEPPRRKSMIVDQEEPPRRNSAFAGPVAANLDPPQYLQMLQTMSRLPPITPPSNPSKVMPKSAGPALPPLKHIGYSRPRVPPATMTSYQSPMPSQEIGRGYRTLMPPMPGTGRRTHSYGGYGRGRGRGRPFM